MRRICYLASGPVPSDAANSVHVAHMCDALGDIGYAVTLLSPTTELHFFNGVDALRKLYGIKGTFTALRIWEPQMRGGGWLHDRLLRLAMWRSRPDLVYGRHLHDCLVAAQGGYPTVHETHMPVWDRDHDGFRRDFEALLEQPAFRALVVISKALADAFVERYPTLEKRIIVDPDAAPEWPSSAPLARSGREQLRVLYVGSLYPGKGMELLAKLAPRCPWAQFMVIGGAQAEIGGWRGALPEGTENLEFLGRMPHTAVRQHMASADVLVAPYQRSVKVHGNTGNVARWMSPLKLFEYMAAGRPIVCSDLPVIREVLVNERNALLVDPDDVEAWEDALRRIVSSPQPAQEMADRARREYERRYTWRARAKRVMDAVNGLG